MGNIELQPFEALALLQGLEVALEFGCRRLVTGGEIQLGSGNGLGGSLSCQWAMLGQGFAGRNQGERGYSLLGALGVWLEETQGLDLIPKELNAHRLRAVGR